MGTSDLIQCSILKVSLLFYTSLIHSIFSKNIWLYFEFHSKYPLHNIVIIAILNGLTQILVNEILQGIKSCELTHAMEKFGTYMSL